MYTTVLSVKPSEARAAVTAGIQAKLVPMLHGSPAIGKSSIMHSIADEYNLKMIDLRLSQCDPTDLLGFPRVQGDKAGYVPMDTFPIAGDDLPIVMDADGKPVIENGKTKHYAGWLLFLDELPTASPAVQAAAYKLVLDRMVGNHPLHKNVAIVAAGNLESDNALVQPMSTALQSRLMHLSLRLDHEEWLDWARKEGVDFRITSYIQFRPERLYRFDANHTDHTYPAPRTWHFLDKAMKSLGQNCTTDPIFEYIAAGCVSAGEANEFIQYCAVETQIPKISAIVNDPTGIKVPEEPSMQYLLSGYIGSQLVAGNADQVMQYVNRLPSEFQVISLREAIKRQGPGLLSQASIQKWVVKAGNQLV